LSAIQQTGLSIGGVVEHFENVLPKSQAEVSVILQRLQRAGFRDESAVKIFYGSKVLFPMLSACWPWLRALDRTARFSSTFLPRHWDFWRRISGWESG
jgi:hypothetical protein